MEAKEYRDARICLLNFEAVYYSSVKDLSKFCIKNNIKIGNLKGDAAKLFSHFLIDNIYSSYEHYKTTHNKVFGVPANLLNNKHIANVLSVITVPWCKITSINSPDNKYVALNAIHNSRDQYKRIRNFVNKNNLNLLQKKLDKQKYFSNGIVDFSKDKIK